MFLYVAGNPNGPVKVGFSTNPIGRVAALRNSSPEDVRLIKCFSVGSSNQVKAVESAVHLAMSEHRAKGEWFNLSADDAASAIERIASACGLPLAEEASIVASSNQARLNPQSAPRRTGRPYKDGGRKEQVSIRLDPRIIEHYRSLGDGWQAKLNDDLLRLICLAGHE